MELYDAFISYSHARDKPIAAALQSAVQKLGKPWYRRRALRVFRDDTSLSATPQLWPTIQQALAQSRYLILLASPEAAASPWVDKEVDYWLGNKSTDTLLIAVTDGTLAWEEASGDFSPGAPLPPALSGRFAAEPKWVDLTAYRADADPRDARFTELAAEFAAAIQGLPKEDLLSQEVREQRRALRLAWSAAGALLLFALAATTAGVLAYRAQQTALQAERQALAERDKAARNFKLAQNTAERLVFDIAQELRDVRGMRTETVRKILDTAAATFDSLAAAAPDNLDLQESRAAMLDEFGETYLSVGDVVQALKAFRGSLANRKRVVAANPRSMSALRDLALSYTKVADALVVEADLGEALKHYGASLTIMQRLVQFSPDNPEWLIGVSSANFGIGNVLLAQGKLGEALNAYQGSLAVMERLAERDPVDTRWQHGLSTRHSKIGDAHRAQRDPTRALKSYRAALAIMQRLTKVDPENTRWQQDLVESHTNVGSALAAQGELASALKSYRAGLPIMEALAKSDTGNAEWQYNVSVMYDRIGDILARQGRLDEALKPFRMSLAIRERMANADPHNTQWLHGLALSRAKLVPIYLQQGETEAALAELRQGKELMTRLVSLAPNQAHWNALLAWFNAQMPAPAPEAQDQGSNRTE